MNIIGGLGTGGVAICLIVYLWLGTGKNAGAGRLPALTWEATFFLSLCAGSALAAAGDPLKFSGIVQDSTSALSQLPTGQVTAPGACLLLLIFVLRKKMGTRMTFILSTLLVFFAHASGGTFTTLAGAVGSFVGMFA
ncbi:hypothetical protein [Streptomyces sp. G1]|uniref:hypothetical protein n=1 Tax=Streptomyces sp. G1 TaxID=361572 RepID=UPI00202E65BD|nr:hypothetical protein [Streptomyces sp. G1]MCM1964879.1 hypothetical protein [Streptomyces sp. G1]